ncbi:MAG: 4Fe-4S binding protein [Planctomycetota bacterium]
MKRNIIVINRDKCIGCGQCVNACVGGALKMVDGKAMLAREDHCDGLGVCVGECPVGALTVEEREVATPMPSPNHQPASATNAPHCPSAPAGHACPGTASRVLHPGASVEPAAAQPSALRQWPIQLHLINPASPQFQNADVLLAASCSAFSFGAFHSRLLDGKALIIACPKLDNLDGYVEKLATLLTVAQPRSLTIARMEVPCCGGLLTLVRKAVALSGALTPMKEIILALGGEIIVEHPVAAMTPSI